LQFALAVAGTSLIFVFPGVVRWFVDEIIPYRRTDLIWQAGGLAILAFTLRESLFYCRTRVNCTFEQRVITDLRGQLHRKIELLPLRWFDHQSTGDILTKLVDDVPATQRVILEGIEQGLTALLQILITAVVMLIADAKLALLMLLPTPLIAAGGWIYSRWVSPRATAVRKATSALNATLHDTLTGIHQIKSFTAEEMRQWKFLAASQHLKEKQTHLMAAWAFYAPSMTLLGNLGLVLLLTAGSWWCVEGSMTSGQLMQFVLLVGFLYEPIARLHGVNQTLLGGLAAAKRVFAILDDEIDEDLDAGQTLHDIRGDIAFHSVSFAYREDKPVLHDITLTAQRHQTIAIVGATGSGKSTLFQLLVGFYDPQSGSITLDGIPLTQISRRSLRQSLAYVTQEPFLFAGTVRDNLLLGKPSATDDDLWSALRSACADDFIRRLPEELGAEVGERGVLLSGGERQRLVLARAFLKNAPMLLLDEATSSVDVKSEHLIQQALAKLRDHRTCLIIAHRLSTITAADGIYVLHQGRILAHGKHEELLQSCSYYREMATLAFDKAGGAAPAT
jgi:ATP-binding cassette subfamily B protein/subfamily B ATP-binding cassette protein MsbA